MLLRLSQRKEEKHTLAGKQQRESVLWRYFCFTLQNMWEFFSSFKQALGTTSKKKNCGFSDIVQKGGEGSGKR